MGMTTIQDVARKAHVGVATVSRVLNESGYVKAETRERILDAIRELNYTPNAVARNLYHRKTGIVALIVPEISHPYFAEFIDAAEAALYGCGYQCMICNTKREQNYEAYYLDLLKQQRVDGIITGVHTLDIEQYRQIDRPIVALDRQLGSHIPCVAVNHEEGGRMAAEALIRSGCRKVLQVTGQSHVSTPSNRRHEVFEQVIRESGGECINYLSKWNRFSYSYNREAALEIAENYPDIDGFFSTDVITAAVLHAMKEKGRRCPEDFSAVAYDGTFVSRLPYPELTTIVQPISELAETCVDLLMKQIRGDVLSETNIRLNVIYRQGATTA